MSEIKTGIG